ncbi:MAG TPA: tripartite tricarboxylate transporter permease [Burkholderiales bacterium]|jgi:putative tricarboxylic transport membrane protein|nr:tripartite tricarboxylate transporter permease [Burkholderiales bacterium]
MESGVVTSLLWGSVQSLITPSFLVIILLGVIAGIIFGILPGFGAAQALALLFPFTYSMDGIQVVIFMLAAYSAAEYGGSIPAILIRTPGTPSAAITTIEAYPLAQRGFPRKTLRISLTAGLIGGVLSTAAFIAAGPLLAWIGLRFGPSEMFAVGVFGLSIISSFLGGSVLNGFLSTAVGLWLATIGNSDFGGMRFTFDWSYLYDGIPLLVVIIGILAMPEAFRLICSSTMGEGADETQAAHLPRKWNAKDRLSWLEFKRLLPSFLRGSVVGTAIGIMPGAGGTVASIVSYNEERRWSKRGHLFGSGVEEGVAGPEAANNAVVAGALVPTLALGIPGSASAAVLLGVMIGKGVVPGPLLFHDQPGFVMQVFIGLIIINLVLYGVGWMGTNVFAWVTRLPNSILGPVVMILILIGTYSYRTEFMDVVIALGFGVVGYILEKIKFPTLPMLLAFVMQPIMEENLLRALSLYNDIFSVMSRPLTAVILLLAVSSAVWGYLRSRQKSPDAAATL